MTSFTGYFQSAPPVIARINWPLAASPLVPENDKTAIRFIFYKKKKKNTESTKLPTLIIPLKISIILSRMPLSNIRNTPPLFPALQRIGEARTRRFPYPFCSSVNFLANLKKHFVEYRRLYRCFARYFDNKAIINRDAS